MVSLMRHFEYYTLMVLILNVKNVTVLTVLLSLTGTFFWQNDSLLHCEIDFIGNKDYRRVYPPNCTDFSIRAIRGHLLIISDNIRV